MVKTSNSDARKKEWKKKDRWRCGKVKYPNAWQSKDEINKIMGERGGG